MIQTPGLQTRILKLVAENKDLNLEFGAEQFPGIDFDSEEILAQTQLAMDSGLLDATAIGEDGGKIGAFYGGNMFLTRPVVTESGRAYLRMRAPFWWVRFTGKRQGVWAAIGATFLLPISLTLLFIRFARIAVRVKLVSSN